MRYMYALAIAIALGLLFFGCTGNNSYQQLQTNPSQNSEVLPNASNSQQNMQTNQGTVRIGLGSQNDSDNRTLQSDGGINNNDISALDTNSSEPDPGTELGAELPE